MEWEHVFYITALIVAAGFSIRMAWVTWRRQSPFSKTGALGLIAVAIWLIGDVFERLASDLQSKVFWDNAQFFGAFLIPAVWIIYTFHYTGRSRWVTRPLVMFFVILYFGLLMLALTNNYHNLIWARIEFSEHSRSLLHESGIALRLFIGFTYVALGTGVILLMHTLIRSRRLYRWQATALTLAILTPWFVDVLSTVADLDPILGFDPTPLAMGITLPAIAWGFARLRRLDIAPVARDLVFEGMSDSVLVLGSSNRVVDLNPAARRLLDYTAPEAVDQPVEPPLPDWLVQHVAAPGDAAEIPTIPRDAQGERHYYDLRLSPLTDWRGQVVSRVMVVRDVTARVEAESRVKESLAEKEVLLKEIHHRVKNNLQIVSSLLNLQGAQCKDAQMREAFRDSQNRIRSMALIHERLYQSQDLARVDLTGYVESLASQLFRSYSAGGKGIELRTRFDPITLGIDLAIPCGLILNELISNALKHAFPAASRGEIRVEVSVPSSGTVCLVVADNGVGFPDTVDFRATTSLGLQLVNTLVNQLNGRIELTRQSGAHFTITFSTRTPG